MKRVAIYGVPGLDAAAPTIARRLRDAVESWFDAHPAITHAPRRYGYHATLKAPFALAEGTTLAELQSAVAEFARCRQPELLHELRATRLGSFRALVPHGGHGAVDRLAADVVRAFDRFRAPLAADDIARRRPERLTPRQREILHDCGYPYALDEFRFHITLTDALSEGTGAEADGAIAEHFALIDGADVPLTSLAIVTEPAVGMPFSVHSVHPFREAS